MTCHLAVIYFPTFQDTNCYNNQVSNSAGPALCTQIMQIPSLSIKSILSPLLSVKPIMCPDKHECIWKPAYEVTNPTVSAQQVSPSEGSWVVEFNFWQKCRLKGKRWSEARNVMRAIIRIIAVEHPAPIRITELEQEQSTPQY